jgi:hypothetical protein
MQPKLKRALLIVFGLFWLAIWGRIMNRVFPSTPKPLQTQTMTPSAPIVMPLIEALKPKTPPPPTDKWRAGAATSEMDDTKTEMLSLDAENEIPGLAGDAHRPHLLIRCKRNLDLYIVTEMPPEPEFGEDDYLVQLRFDAAKPLRQRWSISNDRNALFAAKPTTTFEQLLHADLFKFQFTPFAGSDQVITFDVRGLEHHKADLKACLNAKH